LPAFAQIFQKNIAGQRESHHQKFSGGVQIHNKLDRPRQILTRSAIPETVTQPNSAAASAVIHHENAEPFLEQFGGDPAHITGFTASAHAMTDEYDGSRFLDCF